MIRFFPMSAVRQLVVIAVLSLVALIPVYAQTTSFSYQGRFTDSTSATPTTGTYDFEFKLYSDAAGICQVGVTVPKTGVSVTAGTFAVELDFGNQFDGSDLWLGIAVKKPADPTYTALTPAQKINSVPYAVRAANVAVASGSSVVTAINDASTSGSISADRVSDGVAKIGVTEQGSVSTDVASPVINIKSSKSVGGTVTDVGRFRFGHDGSLIVSGILGTGTVPDSTPGTRLMWYPGKSAFRVGTFGATEIGEEKIGSYSVAGGYQNESSGNASTTFGSLNKSSGTASTTFGRLNVASAMDTFAVGYSNIVTQPGASAIGVFNTCTGYLCRAIGYENLSLGANSVAIGAYNTAAGESSFTLGSNASTCKGTLTYSGNIPTCSSAVNGAFVWSDSAPFGSVIGQADNEFRARAVGGFRFRTSEAASDAVGANGNVGCDLDNGSSTWTCASSRSLKTNFTPVSGEDLLGRLRKMPMTTWSFVGEQGSPLHLGPVAEDFFEAFRLGKSDKSIGVQDLAGVSLAATKALEERTAKLQAENDELRFQLANLAKRLESLEKSGNRKPAVRSRRR